MRPGSGKKDSSFKRQNRSNSRDKSKSAKIKESSHNQKLDSQALLRSLKNTQKPSTMGPLLEILDNKGAHKKKVKPPKVPKQFKMNFKENIAMNLENLNVNQIRSRQIKNFEKKSITIQHSPTPSSNLEFKENTMKRKSSFVGIKPEKHNFNLNFLKNKKGLKKFKSNSILHKTHSVRSVLSLHNSSTELRNDDSIREFNFVTSDLSKKSLLESFNRDKPEIEFVVNYEK
jgi:hypothetical protein